MYSGAIFTPHFPFYVQKHATGRCFANTMPLFLQQVAYAIVSTRGKARHIPTFTQVITYIAVYLAYLWCCCIALPHDCTTCTLSTLFTALFTLLLIIYPYLTLQSLPPLAPFTVYYVTLTTTAIFLFFFNIAQLHSSGKILHFNRSFALRCPCRPTCTLHNDNKVESNLI